ncbi:B3 domain-containing protein Os01g0234100-like isoform X2 [Impatiens glandulifera]|uniref:B3 domain-containing protein Os01g0234100-like isoform X2 n=1 Tax=Impatiens glandulifera TaxID=253017 RepID=UPI001FB06CCA|nr:B3 domain-containing protein Os01g0234100-like isoform X2 [Impatiens glandulifera]
MGSETRTIAQESVMEEGISNHVDVGEIVKKEVIVVDHLDQVHDCSALPPDSDTRSVQEEKTPPSSIIMGKRKIKRKEIYDDELLFFRVRNRKRKKKKPLSPKSEPAMSNLTRKSPSTKRRKTGTNGSDEFAQVKTPAMIRAEKVQASLGSEFQTFTKLLVRSHVSSCFWMGLPGPFCKLHLPREDSAVILEDENGQQFDMKYIAEKTGLSAGWRKFAYAHQLIEGDALVFQLVEHNKFKVFVVRANDLTEVDGALSLLNLEAQTKPDESEKLVNLKEETITLKGKKRKNKKSLALVIPVPLQQVEPFENDSEEVGSEVVVGPTFSNSTAQFEDLSFEDFHIVVDGFCIDSKLPEQTMTKYYELCCDKNEFLHSRVVRGLNLHLVAGIISEIVNISDSLKTCTLSTPKDEFVVWEKTLKSFELLGMNVGFLHARLCRLLSLAHESEEAVEVRKYWEAKSEKNRIEEDIRSVEAKLIELLEASEKYDGVIEALKPKVESYEIMFQEEINAPW